MTNIFAYARLGGLNMDWCHNLSYGMDKQLRYTNRMRENNLNN